MRRVLMAKFDVQSTAAITRDDHIVEHFSLPPAVANVEDTPLDGISRSEGTAGGAPH